jgi:hypothetical protein
MNILRLTAAAGCAVALLGLVACNTTQLESNWKAPEIGAIKFTKVIVIAATADEASRRIAEDTMKAQITGIPVVASYELLPKFSDQKNRAKVAQAIRDSGADGIVVVRTVSDAKEVSYTPGSPMPMPYRSFYGYYTRPYAMQPMYWDAGTLSTDRVIGMETNIYNAKDEQLIWTGLTRSTNPGSVQRLINEVAEVVRAKLREQKLIP